MTIGPRAASSDWTVADLLEHFGPILHGRIRQEPSPGRGTEQDVLEIYELERRLFELVDGVLVEKIMGIQEAYVAALLILCLGEFLRDHDLGFVLGADGMARLAPGLVRIPDVSFVSWKRVPEHRIPRVPMLTFAPDLAIEVLSPGNTREEMGRKLDDYVSAGVQLVWFVDTARRVVRLIRTGAADEVLLRPGQTLTGEPVLPGFGVTVDRLFERLEP